MHTSTLDLENPRAAKPPRPGSQPGSGQAVSAAAREVELQRIEGMKIAQSAVRGIGMSTKEIRDSWMNTPNCALAVSLLFTRATDQRIVVGTGPNHVLSTSLLYNSLMHDSRFMQVSLIQSSPGDIVVQSGLSPDGYAGIVVDHERIISDSSNGVQNNTSLVEIERRVPPVSLFRYIGVQKPPGYTLTTLANAGFNPDEPRLPAGRPGGGQWATGSTQWTDAGSRTTGIHGAYDTKQGSLNCDLKHAKSSLPRMRGRLAPDGSITVERLPDKDDNDNNDPKTIGRAAKETGQSFLSGIVTGLRSLFFPSAPDQEPSKPKNIFQIDKERNGAADGTDITTPKGLGGAAAAGTLITAGQAVADGVAASAPEPEPSGLDATSEAKSRVQASKDAYGGVDAQNMGKQRGGVDPVNKGKEGVAQSEAEAVAAGEKVKGKEVTFELPSGNRTRSDLVTENEEGLKVREAKKGATAKLSAPQTEMQQTAETGGTVIPRGANAKAAGLKPGEPIKIPQHEVDHH